MKRNGAESTSWRTGLVGGLLALSPALAVAQQAQTPFASAVLYEVREDINCNPGTSTAPDCGDTTANGFGTRIADATLEGATTGAIPKRGQFGMLWWWEPGSIAFGEAVDAR